MRITLAVLAALIFSLSSSATALAQSSEFTIAGIYFFGCDGSYVEKVKSALPIHVGEKHTNADIKPIKKQIGQAVWKVINTFPTDVAVINVGNQNWNLYIGLPGRSMTYPSYNPAPTQHLELPKEATDLDDETHRILTQLLAEKGGCHEDDSKGYSLAEDPKLRAKELEFRSWALQHEAIVRDVLKSSSDANQRQVAAEALGYVDPSKEQIDALVAASMDENSGVRNNATRALGCIASSSKSLAAQVPCDKFIQILNSGSWTDRNKAEFVIDKLCKQDPALLPKVQDNAVQALAEMACWDQPHAMSARWLLKLISGLRDDRLDPLFVASNVDAIVNATKNPSASAAPPAPSLAELYVILKEIFAADQSDKTRTKSFECYKKLSDLKEKFVGTRAAADYFNALSFESFHMGQVEAMDKKNKEAALVDFKKSLPPAEEALKCWQDRHEKYMEQYASEWASYVRATTAFLEGDVAQVEQLKDKCGSNNKTIARLLSGSKKFGSPDYRRDYMGEAAATSTP